MIRSFYSAVTGLAGNQTYTDVVANNLANINTVGFHRSRVDIETLISHLKRSGTPPTEALGGINASQVGAGMSIGSISKVFTQGALQETGRPMDVAIDGDGFMIVDDGTRTRAFTRDGQLQMDVDGNLVQSVSGYKVMGYAPGGQPAPATETAAAGAEPDALTATDTAAAAAAGNARPPRSSTSVTSHSICIIVGRPESPSIASAIRSLSASCAAATSAFPKSTPNMWSAITVCHPLRMRESVPSKSKKATACQLLITAL